MLQTKELMGHRTWLPVFLFVSLMCFVLFHFWGVGIWGFVAGLGFFLPEELLPHGLTVPGKREEACQQEAVTRRVLYS